MTKKFYEVVFEVTETCQNGKERRFKKSVYSPVFKNGIHVTEQERAAKGTEVLESLHYYNVQYIETRNKVFLFTEEC